MTETGIHVSNEEDIKPNITREEVEVVLDKFYGLNEITLEQLMGYDDLNYHCLPKFSYNPFIKTIWPHGYVLKILNSLDSKANDLCEAQNNMLLFLRENNIPSPLPVKNLFGQYFMKLKFPQKATDNLIQKEHTVKLLEFQPGTTLKNIPKSYSLFYELGIFVAKINEVLKKFSHPVYKTHYSIWHLHSVTEVKSLTDVIENPRRRRLVENILKQFIQEVLSKKESFEQGMIHGDFNEHNILMSKSDNGEWEVSAILDFGDSHKSCYLFELAISLCYMMFECKRCGLDYITGGGHLLAGYLAIRPTFLINFNFLKISICARICQSLVLGLKSYSLHPENTYVLDSQQMGWPLLEELWEISIQGITEVWESVFRSYNIQI